MKWFKKRRAHSKTSRRTSPKVLMVVENLPVPRDKRVWAEATTLRDHGFKVTIICPRGATEHREGHVYMDGIHIYRYRLPAASGGILSYGVEYGVALFMTWWLSMKVLRRHGFDVIHAANPPDLFFLLALFYRPLGKKYIFDQHDLAPEMFQVKFQEPSAATEPTVGADARVGARPTPTIDAPGITPLRLGYVRVVMKRLLLFCERRAYRMADFVIVTNQSQKQVAIERGKCAPSKVVIVRNGPDSRRLRPTRPEPLLKRGKRYMLAYVGVMGKQDGVEYTLYALHHLVYKQERRDLLLVLLGDGDELPALRALAHELNLDAYVHFTGWVHSSELARYLTMADVGLSPDPQNGLNEHCTMIKTMEYMAMGKALVAFDLAETRYSAQDAALYAQPNAVEDFADKIAMLLDNEALRLQLGERGRRRVEEELSWASCAEFLLLTYTRLFPSSIETQIAARVQESVPKRVR